MAKIIFKTVLSPELWQKYNIHENDNLFITRYPKKDAEHVKAGLNKIFKTNSIRSGKDQEPLLMEVTIKIDYKHRSIDSNSLMWALYEAIADVLNRESGSRSRITPKMLYDEDMSKWADRHIITCKRDNLALMKIAIEKDFGKVKRIKSVGDEAQIEVWVTSSYWNTKKMTDHIKRLMVQFEEFGIVNEADGDLKKLFEAIEEWKKKHKGD